MKKSHARDVINFLPRNISCTDLLDPKVNIHVLHTVLYTFSMALAIKENPQAIISFINITVMFGLPVTL